VQGAVTIPAGITPTGPLYVGFYDLSSGTAYGTRIASPVTGANNYTIYVPSGSSYFFFGILDQNNDGLVDAGDVANTDQGNTSSNTISISGPLTNENLTLPSANSTLNITTQYYQMVSSGGTATGYDINLDLREGNKLPVAATLTAGPNVINPVDVGACTSCGTPQFQYYTSIAQTVPTVGQSYSFLVTYSDGTSETVTGTIGALLTSSQLATNLSPTGTGVSLTPNFSWTDPANAGSYTYSFSLYDNNGNTI
jgi:hypothetical protein